MNIAYSTVTPVPVSTSQGLMNLLNILNSEYNHLCHDKERKGNEEAPSHSKENAAQTEDGLVTRSRSGGGATRLHTAALTGGLKRTKPLKIRQVEQEEGAVLYEEQKELSGPKTVHGGDDVNQMTKTLRKYTGSSAERVPSETSSPSSGDQRKIIAIAQLPHRELVTHRRTRTQKRIAV